MPPSFEAGATVPQDPDTPIPEEEIETPVAVVDLNRVRANARRVVTYATRHGLGWRPHVKTHKSRTIARIQLEAGARGLTVATLREAEAMAPLTEDLLLAYPQVGAAKARRMTRLLEGGTRLKVALDSPEALATAAAAGRDAGSTVGVLVELDVGMGRVGLPSPESVTDLALRIARTPGTGFGGVLFYPGHIRVPAEEQDEGLRDVAGRVEATLEALRKADLEVSIVSGGSTPTLFRSHEIPGLTEIRPGTAIFQDRDMVSLGVCSPDEVAYHVLATVVSTAVEGRAVVDAGSKALAREEFRGGEAGYGIVAGRPGVLVAALSEEHGVLELGGSDWRPAVGERVRIVPNHVCVSVNLQDRLFVPGSGGYRVVPLEGRGRAPLAVPGPEEGG